MVPPFGNNAVLVSGTARKEIDAGTPDIGGVLASADGMMSGAVPGSEMSETDDGSLMFDAGSLVFDAALPGIGAGRMRIGIGETAIGAAQMEANISTQGTKNMTSGTSAVKAGTSVLVSGIALIPSGGVFQGSNVVILEPHFRLLF